MIVAFNTAAVIDALTGGVWLLIACLLWPRRRTQRRRRGSRTRV